MGYHRYRQMKHEMQRVRLGALADRQDAEQAMAAARRTKDEDALALATAAHADAQRRMTEGGRYGRLTSAQWSVLVALADLANEAEDGTDEHPGGTGHGWRRNWAGASDANVSRATWFRALGELAEMGFIAYRHKPGTDQATEFMIRFVAEEQPLTRWEDVRWPGEDEAPAAAPARLEPVGDVDDEWARGVAA